MRSWRLPAALVLSAALVACLIAGRIPAGLILAYGVIGLVSLLAYGVDKRFATTGQRRISEKTLHGVDLAFGIVGGLLGQTIFRHKTSKPRYVALTALILLAHLAFLGILLTGGLRAVGG